MPLSTRSYVIAVCDNCRRPSPDWGLHVSAPRVFPTAPEARDGLPRLGWTVTNNADNDGGDDRVWCPPCVCRRDGHDLIRLRRGRQSCRRCGTAWHTPHTDQVVT